MFEYNGQQFTLAEVEEAAANKKMSLDQYINQFGIKKIDSQIVEKPQPAAEIAAPAVGQTPDMGLQLENGSSASANNNILPRDPNEVLAAINAVGVALPLSDNFKKEFVKTVYSGVQSFDYTQAKNRAQKLNDAQAAIEKINTQDQRVRAQAAEEGWSDKRLNQQLNLFVDKGGRSLGKKEEALKYYNNKIKEAKTEFVKEISEGKEYQQVINAMGEGAELFDEEGNLDVQLSDLSKAMGSQVPQVLQSILTAGAGTYIQEAGGMTVEALEAAAQKKYGDKFFELPQEEQTNKLLELVESNEIDFDKIAPAAMGIAGLDLVGNFFVLGKGLKVAPKSVARNFVKGRTKAALNNAKKIATDYRTYLNPAMALTGESGTEALQEGINMAATTAALEDFSEGPIDTFDSDRIRDAAALALITTGPISTTAGGVRRGSKELYRKISGIRDENSVRAITNSRRKKLEQEYTDGTKSEQQVSDELDALDVAEDVAYNRRFRKFEPEAKEEMFDLELEKQKLQRKNEAIKQSLTPDIGNIFGQNEKQKNESRVQEIEQQQGKVIAKQQYLVTDKLFGAFVNNNKELFNGFEYKSFNTKEEFKEFAKENNIPLKGNVEGLANGDNFGIAIPGKKIIVTVKENVNEGIKDFMPLNQVLAANVVHHEGLHALMSTLSTKQLVDLKAELAALSNDGSTISKLINTATDLSIDSNERVQTEEFFAKLSDLLRGKNLTEKTVTVDDASTLGKIGTIISKVLNPKAPSSINFDNLENGSQVIEFIKKYNSFNGKPSLELKLPTIGSKGQQTPEKENQQEFESAASANLSEIYNKYNQDKNTMIQQSLLKTPQGQETFDFSKSEFGQSIGGLVETITKRLYDPVLDDLKRGTTRNQFKNDLISEAATIISNEFNPDLQEIGKFTTNRLNLRANRLAEKTFEQTITQDVTEAKAVVSDERAPEDIKIKQPISKSLKLDKAISSDKIKKLSELSIIKATNALKGKNVADVKKVSIKNKSINEIFNKQLFKDIANELGKNTKNSNNFSKYLNNNYPALLDAAINNIDFQKGTGISANWNKVPPSKKDFIEYYEAKNEKASTRSDRKKSLNEAISRELAKETIQDYVLNDPSINEQFEQDTGISLASAKLRSIITPEIEAKLKTELNQELLSSHAYDFDAAFKAIGLNKLYKDIYGDKKGETNFNNIVKQFEEVGKNLNQNKLIEPTFEYRGKEYTYAGFITDKILDELQNGSYAIQIKAITGHDLNIDLSDPLFVARARNSMAQIINNSKIGRKWANRFLRRGLAAPSKIGNGTVVAENNKLVYKENTKPGTNRLGLFDGATDVDAFIKSEITTESKSDSYAPFATNSAKPLQSWTKEGNTDQGLKEIQLSGNEDNKAFRTLVDVMKEENIGIDESVAILMALNANPLGLTRTSAPLDYTPLNPSKYSQYRLEHMVPALAINLAALDYIFNKKGNKKDFGKMMDSYRTAQLPIKYDNLVNTLYKAHMPFYFRPGDTPVVRYYNVEFKDKFDLEMKQISTGSVINKNYYKDKKQQQQSQKDLNKVFEVEALASAKLSNEFNQMLERVKGVAVNPVKKIRVFDFDDTLAKSNSQVKYTLPDGTTGSLNATEYAKRDQELKDKGAKFDFSEFSKVIDGKKGPLFNVAKKIVEARGNEDLFVLTARPADAAGPIQEFLKLAGVNFKKENIVGLGDGTAKAKADWILSKTKEGYNDFYFADDAIKNVTAVKEALASVDVKSRTQIAFASKRLSDDFNNLLERVKGVPADATYSEARAIKLGKKNNPFKFFVPYSAEDYMGLVYPTLGKGKEGDANLKWYKENITDVYARGIRDFEIAKQQSMTQWIELKKQIKNSPAKLGNDAVRDFSNEEAIRLYLWDQQGMLPDNVAKKDIEAINKYIDSKPELKSFAEQIQGLTLDGYPAPTGDWLAGTITTDLVNYTNTASREQYLSQWQENVDTVYSKDNMNKLRAIYGEDYTEALSDMLYRMKTGRNRPTGANKLTNQFMNWVNDSVGTIMFFNTRSALLQTISAVNYLNFTDNNPLRVAAAFANQKQYWADFSEIFNSDFLKQRRGGLKTDVNADEIARAASTSDNKVRAALASLLKKGFLPTQLADSFAISIGGAAFYRNRIKSLMKDGLTEEQAKEQAFLDFKETTEESQQSSRPDRVSMQQASPLGRVVLAFANTPMQYTRLTKKAALDLFNGRGDWKTNLSKLAYYGAVQNIIFTALQSAMFAMLFSDEEDDKEKEKIGRIGNGIADTLLRGSGVYGAGVAMIKNIVMEAIKQYNSGRPDYTKAAAKITSISPPVDSKIRKLQSVGRTFTYKQEIEKMKTKGFDIDNPAYMAVGQTVSALANIPLDRAVRKMNNLKTAVDQDTELWQSIGLALGYSEWDLGMIKKNTKKKTIKISKPKSYKQYRPIGGSKRKKKSLTGIGSGIPKVLPKGVLGRANRDGSIEVAKGLSPTKKKQVIAHEQKHQEDMKSGKLDYDKKFIYWNNKKYKRTADKKINYKGKLYIEGSPALPWEKAANKAEKQIN